jgi:tetratricopeptide (TPR) repeat protein
MPDTVGADPGRADATDEATEAADAATGALAAADEAFARMDVEAVVAHLSAAVRGFTAAGDTRRAALASVRLGDALGDGLGNLVAARAWYARAARLLADEPPCVEQGWVAVAGMGCDVGDPAELLASAELALDRARRFGDVNLEAKALADGGLAHVQAGRVDEGMALLDEAMALACGPADDRWVAGRSVCSFFTACYYAADFARAATWADLFRRAGLIGAEGFAPAYLASHCDAVAATMLGELGRWGEAEAVLVRASEAFRAAVAMPAWHPDIVLADLRIRQGRLAEAETLLLGKDVAFEALLPAARLHLARGDHELARAAAGRGLRALGGDRLRAAELLGVLVEAALADGDLPAAEAACAELSERVGGVDVPSLRARCALVRARVLAAGAGEAGDGGDRGDSVRQAVGLLEAAVDTLDPGALPWLRATLLLELAGLRERAGDRVGASVDATAAAGALSSLDVVLAEPQRALLHRLTTPPAAPGDAATPTGTPTGGSRAPARTAVLARDGRWWVASCGGTTARLPDTKGLRYLAELVARPGVERHALDLVDRVEGVGGPGAPDRRALGDAGELADARARREYRRRVESLRAAADEALAAGRDDDAERAQDEADRLVRELARAFGLGGRPRRAGSAAEKARLNVTRALRAAIVRLAEALPGDTGQATTGDGPAAVAPAAALDRGVRTGLYCAYAPVDGDVRWCVDGSFGRD